MFKNYFLVSLRNLKKNKRYVIINILGLGVSMACCIAAYLMLAYNIEFDSYYKNQDVSTIYKLHTLSRERDGRLSIDAGGPIALPPAALDEIAGIETYTRFIQGGGAVRYQDNIFNEGIAFADSAFFDMFNFKLLKGSARSFHEKNSIFINEATAKKYFGDGDPIGKLMTIDFVNDKHVEVTVGGVVERIPVNNTFGFHFLMRIENFIDVEGINQDNWADWRDPAAFFKLKSAASASTINAQLKKYVPNRNKLRTDMVTENFKLEPFMAPFDFDTLRYSWLNHRLSLIPIVIITSLALLILLIACFNLTNTSIAMTANRLKEVGVRKAIGAAANQIATQFMIETLIVISLSLLAGLVMAQYIVPAFTDMWRLPYGLQDLNGVNLVVALIVLVFLAAMLAGMYPALFSSKFKATALLKGGIQVKGANGLTRTLVGIQFALSVVVLIGGVVFTQNAAFQEKIKFGYDKDMIITVQLQGGDDFEAMEKALSSNPKIISLGASDGNLGQNTYPTPIQLDTATYDVQVLGVGKNFFETMGLKTVQGRVLNLDNASDAENIVVNTAFLEKTGLTDPLDKIVTLHGGRTRIVGVVQNHVDNLFRSREFEPFIFYATAKSKYISLLVKAAKSDLTETQKDLEKTWKQVLPTKPFESQLQEDVALKGSRERNANLKKIFLFITIIGSTLSASGIFALASLTIAKRTKEIGIRKVLGASRASILALLNKQFVITLSIAGVMGSIVGYYFTSALLSRIYAYHISVGIAVTIGCAVAIFLIGIFTTSSSIMKAASSNPVDTLRNN